MFKSLLRIAAIVGISASSIAGTQAAEPTKERSVELFSAIESGEIKAELIAPSAKQIYLRVDNQTKDMLKIELPKSFAAVPVLGQFQPGFPGAGAPGIGGAQGFGQQGFGQGAGGQAGNGGGTQGLGGGFNGGAAGNNFGNQFGNGANNGIGQGNPFGNAFGNRGVFRVPAGKVAKISADTVCLEHGKPEPTSKAKYRIVPIDQFNSDPQIAHICQLLGRQQISQSVAQAAAWHVANHLPWDQLAQIDRVQSKYTGNIKMFSSEELQAAQRLVESARETSNQVVSKSTPTAKLVNSSYSSR